MTTLVEPLRDLVAAEPALAALVHEHRAEYGREMRPHVFMADVARWLAAHGPAPAIPAVLERHFAGGNAHVRDTVALGLVENLEPGHAALRDSLGPALRAELEAQERWTPGGRAPAT